ncbi:chorismate-binding protein [Gemmatimonadales bacterium]|nr:chorismate-binding protein [Gemmatimonadales bacterium]
MADTEKSEARVTTVPLVTTLSIRTAPDPVAVLEALGAKDGRRVLLESMGNSPEGDRPPTVTRSVVVADPLLSLEARAGEVTWSILQERAEPLLSVLAERLRLPDGYDYSSTRLQASFPTEPRRGLMSDADRITSSTVLDALRATAGLLVDRGSVPFASGIFGAFSYELVDQFETLPPRAHDPLDEPDFSFVLGADLVLWDHELEEVFVITRSFPWEEVIDAKGRHRRLVHLVESISERDPSDIQTVIAASVMDSGDEIDWTASLEKKEFEEVVSTFLGAIREGQIFQGVPSRSLRAGIRVDPLELYRRLRHHNPSPYMFYLDLGAGALVGASPETCLRVQDRVLEIRPIAGTTARGRRVDGSMDTDTDDRLALALSLDQKELAEHCMLVDLARNDVARVSMAGSTRVVQQIDVERYAHVQHLVSRVRGRLREGYDALHAYRAVANMGTLTGAPKLKAMELIRLAEPESRGFYGGAVGYLLSDGTFDSCIVIRSARVLEDQVVTQVGAGIVVASVPSREFEETERKARSLKLSVAAVQDKTGGAERRDFGSSEQEEICELFPEESGVDERVRIGGVKTAVRNSRRPRVVVVDHRDSFVFILGDQLARAGADVVTVRCDASLRDFAVWIREQSPDLVVLSPGPGGPRDTGFTLPWLQTDPDVPILGVCLGHQALAEAGGGVVTCGPEPVHGKTSTIEVESTELDTNPLARAFVRSTNRILDVARYHSLIVTRLGPNDVPIARVRGTGEVMAMGHRTRPRLGLQFHPESILTPTGGPLIEALLSAAIEHGEFKRAKAGHASGLD